MGRPEKERNPSKELKFDRVCKYVIPGDPIGHLRNREANTRVIDGYHLQKTMYRNHLEQQHNEQPLFDGPLHLDIYFYFAYPRKQLFSTWHTEQPLLSNLMIFIEKAAHEVLFGNVGKVCSATINKQYEDKARTEITISQIKKGKG